MHCNMFLMQFERELPVRPSQVLVQAISRKIAELHFVALLLSG